MSKDQIGVYSTEDSAYAAVRACIAAEGRWPGVVHHEDGSFSLMGDANTRRDKQGDDD